MIIPEKKTLRRIRKTHAVKASGIERDEWHKKDRDKSGKAN